MRSAVRAAIAWMVSDGFTAPDVGKIEPSQMKRLGGRSQDLARLSDRVINQPLIVLRMAEKHAPRAGRSDRARCRAA
jgi:hypothetical protein